MRDNLPAFRKYWADVDSAEPMSVRTAAWLLVGCVVLAAALVGGVLISKAQGWLA
jgi:hypothetical protein